MLTAPIGAIRAVLIRAEKNMHFNSQNRRRLTGISKDTCQSAERAVTPRTTQEPAAESLKIIFNFPFPLILFLVPFHTHAHTNTHTLPGFQTTAGTSAAVWHVIYRVRGERKRGTYSLRWVYSSLALQMHQICYRKCDQGQAWMPLRVIVEGTRCRWQLKGDTDNSYLSITVLLTHLKPETCGLYAQTGCSSTHTQCPIISRIH